MHVVLWEVVGGVVGDLPHEQGRDRVDHEHATEVRPNALGPALDSHLSPSPGRCDAVRAQLGRFGPGICRALPRQAALHGDCLAGGDPHVIRSWIGPDYLVQCSWRTIPT